jgi:hypothetical protein
MGGDHADRILKVTCNFTHPSGQVPAEKKVYKAGSFTYDFPSDSLSKSIVEHAKRKYAAANKIKGPWLGSVTTTTSTMKSGKADSSLKEKVTLPV